VRSPSRSRIDDGLLGLLPVLVAADVLAPVLLVAQAHLGLVNLEVQGLEDQQHQVDHLHELLLHLVGRQKRWASSWVKPRTRVKAMQFAALLVAVHGAELSVADRQVLVAARPTGVDLAVVRAVHRLQHELLAFMGVLIGWKLSLPYFS
jgi:hypothetical protein